MASLQEQAQGIIETCKIAIAASKKGEDVPVDKATITIATAILEQAKRRLPEDKVVAAAAIEPYITWTMILAAMQTVAHSLPPDSHVST